MYAAEMLSGLLAHAASTHVVTMIATKRMILPPTRFNYNAHRKLRYCQTRLLPNSGSRYLPGAAVPRVDSVSAPPITVPVLFLRRSPSIAVSGEGSRMRCPTTGIALERREAPGPTL